MRQTDGKIFLDSNILIYSYSNSEPEKQQVAQELITNTNSFISTQVLQELTNTITRKFKFTYSAAKNVIQECCQNSFLHINTADTIAAACGIASKYGFSFYDSLIIAAAIECECTVLYSEDMQNGQIINSVLTIRDPFSSLKTFR